MQLGVWDLERSTSSSVEKSWEASGERGGGSKIGSREVICGSCSHPMERCFSSMEGGDRVEAQKWVAFVDEKPTRIF